MFVARIPPSNTEELQQYLSDEFKKIEIAIQNIETDSICLTQLNVAPEKPRDGYVYYADGTNWNPGSGAGLYEYIGGAYAKL